jgi:hypothetical protein
VKTIHHQQKEDSRREKKRAPSEQKAQALRAWLPGQRDAQSDEELVSTFVRVATKQVLQDA